jgi:hypothetical protein
MQDTCSYEKNSRDTTVIKHPVDSNRVSFRVATVPDPTTKTRLPDKLSPMG